MITLTVCAVIALVSLVLFLFLGLPLMLFLGLAPWLLGIVGVVLLFKALVERPVNLTTLTPALVALGSSIVLRWIF